MGPPRGRAGRTDGDMSGQLCLLRDQGPISALRTTMRRGPWQWIGSWDTRCRRQASTVNVASHVAVRSLESILQRFLRATYVKHKWVGVPKRDPTDRYRRHDRTAVLAGRRPNANGRFRWHRVQTLIRGPDPDRLQYVRAAGKRTSSILSALSSTGRRCLICSKAG